MNRKKHIIVLTASLLLNCFYTGVYAKDTTFGDENEWMYSENYINDVYKWDITAPDAEALSIYQQEINELEDFGIISWTGEDGKELDTFITCREFAEAVKNMKCYPEARSSEFNTVSGSDEFLTVKSALTVLTQIVSFENYNFGGMGDDVRLNAYVLGIAKASDNLPAEGYLTYETAAKLIHNTLFVDMYVQNYVGDAFSYKKADGVNILSEYLEIYEVSGIVNNVCGLNLYSSGQAYEEGYGIEIDRVKYNAPEEMDLSGLFAKNVYGYAKKTENGYDIVSLYETENTSVTGCSRDITDITNDYVIFEKGDEWLKVSLKNIQYAMYNGDYLSVDRVTEILANESCVATFTRAEEGGAYKNVIIKSYDSFLISAVSSDRYIFSDNMKFEDNTYLDITDFEGCISIKGSDGNKKSIEEIKKLSVISVFKNTAGTYMEIIISAKSFTGMISGITDDEYICDGNKYRISAKYIEAVDAGYADPVEAGSKGTFYVNFLGEICGFENNDTVKYGFLKNVAETDDEGGETVYLAKIFTESGDWEKLYFIKKILLDGIRTDADKAVLSIKQSALEKSLVKYKLNSDGKIISLDTLNDTTAEAGNKDRMVKEARVENYTLDHTQGRNFKNIPECVLINSSTKIFYIPDEGENEAYCEIRVNTDMKQHEILTIDFYCVDDFCVAEAVVVSSWKLNKTYLDATFLAVNKVINQADEDCGSRESVIGYTATTKVAEYNNAVNDKYIENDGTPLTDKTAYQYSTSKDGRLESLKPVFKNGEFLISGVENYGNTGEIAVGIIEAVNDSYIKINIDGSSYVWYTAKGCYIVYESDEKLFRQGVYTDAAPGDAIMITGSYKSAAGILICH